MKRDLDLVRKIMLAIEGKTDDRLMSADSMSLSGHTTNEIKAGNKGPFAAMDRRHTF